MSSSQERSQPFGRPYRLHLHDAIRKTSKKWAATGGKLSWARRLFTMNKIRHYHTICCVKKHTWMHNTAIQKECRLLCGSCKNRRFGGTYRNHLQGDRYQRTRNVAGNLQLKHSAKQTHQDMEAIRSSETSVLKTATRRNIPEDGTLHSYRRESLQS
jgi:hypothetical protein